MKHLSGRGTARLEANRKGQCCDYIAYRLVSRVDTHQVGQRFSFESAAAKARAARGGHGSDKKRIREWLEYSGDSRRHRKMPALLRRHQI